MTNHFPLLLHHGSMCASCHSAPPTSCPLLPVLHCCVPVLHRHVLVLLLLASCTAVSLLLHPPSCSLHRHLVVPSPVPSPPFINTPLPAAHFHPGLYWPCRRPGHYAHLSVHKPFFYLLFCLCLLLFLTHLCCPFPSCHVPIPTHTYCIKPPFTAPPLHTPSSYSSSPPALVCMHVPPLLYVLGLDCICNVIRLDI